MHHNAPRLGTTSGTSPGLFGAGPRVTLCATAAAYFPTRGSLDTFEVSIRYHLGLVSQESTMFYKEIDG